MKMDFYSYENCEMYNVCKECFNKKVRGEFCNKKLIKSYLRSHIKKQHIQHNIQHHYNQQHIHQQRYNGSGIGSGVYNDSALQ